MKKRFSISAVKVPKWLINSLLVLVLILFVGTILAVSLRGNLGNPSETQINTTQWKESGPLELSPERGRFALTYSIVEHNSVHFSVPIARFATPDLGYKDGNYVSLFAQGVSYLVVPGYMIGKTFGISQVGTYAVISVFALLNVLLIMGICLQLGVKKWAAVLAGFTFLFATPAFVYAVSLFQHHVSIFLLLLSIYILVKFKSVWSLAGVWFLAALSLSVDYPNFFMMFPIGVFALLRLVPVEKINNKISLHIHLLGFLTFIAAVLPLAFLLWFNKVSYGSPFQLAGTVASVQEIDSNGKPTVPKGNDTRDLQKFSDPNLQKKSAVAFFNTRNMLSAIDIQWFGWDRGIIFYNPVIILGFAGLVLALIKKQLFTGLLLSVMLANITLYSMWGDFWGGWAFGTRYLSPSYAILAIFIGILLNAWRKRIWFLIIFILLYAYSVGVNTLGAITSSANPPQVEVLGLEKLSGIQQKYTYARNWDFLKSGQSKSFIFQTLAKKYLTSQQYYWWIVGAILGPSLLLLVLLRGARND